MTTNSVAEASLRLVICCSLSALIIFAGIGPTFSEPVHGPGSSHNPIVHHPVHGYGSSHDPIVVSTSKYPPGTIVRDHRNGKNCQYTVGDADSLRLYNLCEHGGGRPK